MKIIKVTQSEVSKVAALFNQYRIFYEQQDNLPLATSFIAERVSNSESVVFLALNEQGDSLGFTQLYPSFSSVSAQRIRILNDLFVAANLRGQGVGKALLNAARDFAISTDAKGIALETGEDNLGAQKLYQSLGYQRESDHYHYFLDL